MNDDGHAAYGLCTAQEHVGELPAQAGAGPAEEAEASDQAGQQAREPPLDREGCEDIEHPSENADEAAKADDEDADDEADGEKDEEAEAADQHRRDDEHWPDDAGEADEHGPPEERGPP